MGYLAIYRKYRPDTFEKVVGQEHIVKILQNQIKTDKIGHAYLFSGARGIGKTSIAKIFARAINCTETKTGSPCNKCATCKGIIDGTTLDVIEIDAASNNRVEDIRDLREKVQYPPVNGRYKVYIIDEVHMLTDQAFNALLKTLEEPPSHAVFILATTEMQKIPATILSRCMRLDFKLVSQEEIENLVCKIYDDLGKEYEKDAVTVIARLGAGSVRDALSIADICYTYSSGKLTYKDVTEIVGGTDKNIIANICKLILLGDSGSALEVVDGEYRKGRNIVVLCGEIISALLNMLIIKKCKSSQEILGLPAEEVQLLSSVCEGVENDRILRALEIFNDLEESLRYSKSPRILLETAILKSARVDLDTSVDALLVRVKELEGKIASGNIQVASVKPVENKVVENKKAEEKPFVPHTITEGGQEFVRVEVNSSELFGKVLKALRERKNVIIWTILRECSAKVDGNALILSGLSELNRSILTKLENRNILEEIVKSFGNYELVFQGEKKDTFKSDVKKMQDAFGNIVKTENN